MRSPYPDKGLVLSVFGLLVFGWVMIYSSSALFAENRYGDQFYFIKKQLLWSLVGAVAFLLAANVHLSFLQSKVKPIYLVTVCLLVLVLIIGPKISGARRWIHLPGMNFQPSEAAKLVMVLLVADYMDRRQSRLKDFKRGVMPLLLMVSVMVGLILVEPDLGTPVLMMGVLFSLLMLGGARWSHFFVLGLASLPVLVIGILKVQYRLERFFAYLNPWEDAKGKGYQLIQSLTAMGSGGFFGKGLGNSRLKISNLPECHTDFIFSVLGEELGLLGTMLCAGLFLFLCMRSLKIAKQAPDVFSRMVAAGIGLTIGYQAIINMGVASGLLPTKGMPLPFISFGGSSLVIMLFSVGLLANVSRQASFPIEKRRS
ncbi:MAG: putative peptidoglycan glycosyltransferase FtsW [Elusimicrobia bacterium]|nr:putative peptidoglycan glycosyltransferase FtsW [Elusimicrobiota bacterium]